MGNCVVDPDTPGYGDLHPYFGWPGGCNDVPELVDFLRALFKIGYLAEGKEAYAVIKASSVIVAVD